MPPQTDKHDPNNKAHLYSKKLIEEGDGLPDLLHTKVGAPCQWTPTC